LQNSFKFALTLVLETFKLPRFYTQLGSILVGENMEIQHVLILDVVEDLRSFMLQKFSQRVFVQNTLRGCTIIMIQIIIKLQSYALMATWRMSKQQEWFRGGQHNATLA
jgi:hypothetical protein